MRWLRLSMCMGLGVCFGGTAIAGSAAPTYSRDVAPILNENCVSCHRPGQAAPMALRTYEEVRPWVKSISKYVRQGEMPPWHADPNHGRFKNDRSLTQAEIDTIVHWAKRGAPKGDDADLPPLPEFSETDWRLGEPDFVVEFERVELPATGPDEFRDLVATVDIPEDRYLSALEILPEDRSVVHHVIIFQNGASSQGWIGAWAAGTDPMVFPEGTGRLLKKGARLVADMHYHPSGKAASDVTRLGLHFADTSAIEKELINLWIVNASFSIPPGDPNHEVLASHTFEQDSHILTLAPHMHYRGKDFTYVATYPDGREDTLLKVNDYDFNWQTVYELEQPLAAPKGTRIDCVAHFDNSEGNPDNPDPTRRVGFGDESYDEMMIGFVDYIVDEGRAPEPPQSKISRALDELAAAHPGDAYRLRDADDDVGITALHLPRQGDGVFHLTSNGNATRCDVTHIEWNENAFKCRVTIPGFTTLLFDGSVEPASGAIAGTIRLMNGETLELTGERVD